MDLLHGSPDGKRIIFNTRRDGNYEVYVMDADGKNPQNLTKHRESDWDPSWSPNGRHIVFVSGRDAPRGEIYVMRVDGSNVRRLTKNQSLDWCPSWSPDGENIAFTSSRDGEL